MAFLEAILLDPFPFLCQKDIMVCPMTILETIIEFINFKLTISTHIIFIQCIFFEIEACSTFEVRVKINCG